jgi:hypothetical protein
MMNLMRRWWMMIAFWVHINIYNGYIWLLYMLWYAMILWMVAKSSTSW